MTINLNMADRKVSLYEGIYKIEATKASIILSFVTFFISI